MAIPAIDLTIQVLKVVGDRHRHFTMFDVSSIRKGTSLMALLAITAQPEAKKRQADGKNKEIIVVKKINIRYVCKTINEHKVHG